MVRFWKTRNDWTLRRITRGDCDFGETLRTGSFGNEMGTLKGMGAKRAGASTGTRREDELDSFFVGLVFLLGGSMDKLGANGGCFLQRAGTQLAGVREPTAADFSIGAWIGSNERRYVFAPLFAQGNWVDWTFGVVNHQSDILEAGET